MDIRKFKPKKIVNTKMVVSFVLLCVVTYLIIKLLAGIVSKIGSHPQDDLYTLGATLTFSGKIVVDNKFPNYTHSIVAPTGKTIGLKSTTVNLNAYVGQKIELVGRVKKYFKVTPVLEVDTIKLPEQGLIINSNRYFFVKDLIYLDFSTQQQLSATKSGSDVLVRFNDDLVVSIERFVCSKILKSRDCNALITDYIQNDKDTFQSYRGYTFYKHGTGFWATFDNNTHGFLFKDIADDTILDISTMFRIVNHAFVIENKLPLIQSSCKNDFSQLHSIYSQGTLTYHDPYSLILGLEGADTKKVPATCRVTFDVRNDWAVTDAQFN